MSSLDDNIDLAQLIAQQSALITALKCAQEWLTVLSDENALLTAENVRISSALSIATSQTDTFSPSSPSTAPSLEEAIDAARELAAAVTAVREMSTAENERDDFAVALTELDNEAQALRTTLAKTSGQLTTLQQAHEADQQALRQADARAEAAEAALALTRAELAAERDEAQRSARTTSARLAAAGARADAEAARAGEVETIMRRQIERLRGENSALRAAAAEVADNTDEIVTALGCPPGSSLAEVVFSAGAGQRAIGEVAELRAEISRQRARVSELETEVSARGAAAAAAAAAASASGERERALAEQLGDMSRRREMISIERDNLFVEIGEVNSKLAASETRIRELSAELDAVQASEQRLRAAMAKLREMEERHYRDDAAALSAVRDLSRAALRQSTNRPSLAIPPPQVKPF